MIKKTLMLLGCLACAGSITSAAPLGTAFTYQGRLEDGEMPATGVYGMTFGLYDADSGGAPLGSPLGATVPVTNGLFSVALDFGGMPFNGSACWLEVGVRPNGSSAAYTPQLPRTALTPTPSAIYSQTAGSVESAGNGPLDLRANRLRILRLDPNPSAPNIIGGASGNYVAPGVRGATIAGGGTQADWGGAYTNRVSTNCNYATIGGGLGNTIQSFAAEATIGGGNQNVIHSNAFRSTISGGYRNWIGTNCNTSTISGGQDNSAGSNSAFVGGGTGNHANGSSSTTAGGYDNTASGPIAFIGGGARNRASAPAAVVAGGDGNQASVDYATIGGGARNIASANSATVAGGSSNQATNGAATVGGGYLNFAYGYGAVIAGGEVNTANGSHPTVGGGFQNRTSGDQSVISGGAYNYTIGANTTVAGGVSNRALGDGATVGGGERNYADTNYAAVAGGTQNEARRRFDSVGGGEGNASINVNGLSVLGHNTIAGGRINLIRDGVYDTIGGGYSNEAGGGGGTVPGGIFNKASGYGSFAAGIRAKATHNGSFVWADTSSPDFTSTAQNQFSVRCVGGARFVTSLDGAGNPLAGVRLDPGWNSWGTLSDRNAKKNFQPVDGKTVLAKLAQVPVSSWNYHWEETNATPHLGPMAQDFKGMFYPGRDDKVITTLEFDGVELAAIQGLNELVAEKDARITALEAEMATLKKQLGTQQQTLARWESRLAAMEQATAPVPALKAEPVFTSSYDAAETR